MKTEKLIVNVQIRKWCLGIIYLLVLLRIQIPRWMFTIKVAS